jgi:hypothetical protein
MSATMFEGENKWEEEYKGDKYCITWVGSAH